MAKVKLLDPNDDRRRLDRYELIGEIATGGMATVYLARLGGAGGFQRFVAIKRLHPHLANEEEFVEMFLDEARLAAGIHHPHVVPILEVGTSESGYYLVMEYIEGDTLARIVARAVSGGEMVPRPILVRILLDCLAGLHAAHELTDGRGQFVGLVHRDISPQNLLVGVDGSSRITDFGVARATSRLSSTRQGKLKGKLAYMAPEQTQGVEVDRRADVFSMGIILWEVLASRRLFKADNEAATLSRLLVDPIPKLAKVNPSVPEALQDVAMKALDRDPSKRFQTGAEMADALERAAIASATRSEVGVASPREVASYVQKVIGQEIAAQRESVRAWLAQSEPSGVDLAFRRSSDPGHGLPRATDAGSGERQVTFKMPLDPERGPPKAVSPADDGPQRARTKIGLGAFAALSEVPKAPPPPTRGEAPPPPPPPSQGGRLAPPGPPPIPRAALDAGQPMPDLAAARAREPRRNADIPAPPPSTRGAPLAPATAAARANGAARRDVDEVDVEDVATLRMDAASLPAGVRAEAGMPAKPLPPPSAPPRSGAPVTRGDPAPPALPDGAPPAEASGGMPVRFSETVRMIPSTPPAANPASSPPIPAAGAPAIPSAATSATPGSTPPGPGPQPPSVVVDQTRAASALGPPVIAQPGVVPITPAGFAAPPRGAYEDSPISVREPPMTRSRGGLVVLALLVVTIVVGGIGYAQWRRRAVEPTTAAEPTRPVETVAPPPTVAGTSTAPATPEPAATATATATAAPTTAPEPVAQGGGRRRTPAGTATTKATSAPEAPKTPEPTKKAPDDDLTNPYR